MGERLQQFPGLKEGVPCLVAGTLDGNCVYKVPDERKNMRIKSVGKSVQSLSIFLPEFALYLVFFGFNCTRMYPNIYNITKKITLPFHSSVESSLFHVSKIILLAAKFPDLNKNQKIPITNKRRIQSNKLVKQRDAEIRSGDTRPRVLLSVSLTQTHSHLSRCGAINAGLC